MSTWPDSVEAVYVLCHPQKELARWERLLPHLLSVGIPAERIVICAPTWGSDLTPEQIFAAYDPFLPRGGPALTFKSAGLTRGEISLGLNFADAVQRAAQLPDGKLVITLESDVWLREDFVPRLAALIEDARGRPWDYISLGEGVCTRPPGAPSSYYAASRAYEPPHKWVFRCTDSMLFTTEYLKRLHGAPWPPFKEIIDWEMNAMLERLGGHALWADPPLAEQGTCFSRLTTSLPA